MNFYIYIFYRFLNYYNYKDPQDSWRHAFSSIALIFILHIFTITLYISTFTEFDIVSLIPKGNGRFVAYFLFVLPVYILLFVYYRKKKEFIKFKIEEYSKENIKQRRKRGVFVVLYLILTIALLFSSVTSPGWLK